MTLRLACFVSPHGFGHAARTAAVVEALATERPDLEVEIWTRVPEWFFSDSLARPFLYRPLDTDVGLVQRTSLEEDAARTADALDAFFPAPAELLDEVAGELAARGVDLVLADISPLGLSAARRAGIPAALMENFTWDWIYRAYLDLAPALGRFLDPLALTFAGADLHLQLEPACRPHPGALGVPPVRRRPRRSSEAVRRRLGVPDRRPLVLVTMGGFPWRWESLDRLAQSGGAGDGSAGDGGAADGAPFFVVPGGAREERRRGSGLLLLPERSAHYHPDLVAAADAVVGKLGYSTLAEAWGSRTPFLFVERPRFPESPVLSAFARRELPATAISAGELADGAFLGPLAEVTASPRPAPRRREGARVAARALLAFARRRGLGHGATASGVGG